MKGALPSITTLAASGAVAVAFAVTPTAATAQTIRGRLLDAESGRPIQLGILVLLTTDGDTAGLTASNREGRFSVTAERPGSFWLRASAWGYQEREEGVFELGEDGRLDLDFGIAPWPMQLDEILVPIEGSLDQHELVRNGFVSRYRRGIGRFITPRDLEESPYPHTEWLFNFIPGVRVVPARDGFGFSDYVLFRDPFEGWCTPTIYVDGMRTPYRPELGETLSMLVPIGWLEAVEIYRGPAEIPAEYPTMSKGTCGVIVFWTARS